MKPAHHDPIDNALALSRSALESLKLFPCERPDCRECADLLDMLADEVRRLREQVERLDADRLSCDPDW
jgi:hypothetical protein